jgi:hypothetical protein
MKSVSDLLTSPASVLRTLLSIFVHLLISTIGVIVLAHLLTFLLFKLAYSFHLPATIEQLHWTLTGIPGFPVQAVVGLFVGFVLAKYMRRRVMIWIWLLPLMFLCLGILFSVGDYPSVWDHFFGYGCSPKNRCFDQVGLTLPLVASAAYSLGAKLRRVPRQDLVRAETGPTCTTT